MRTIILCYRKIIDVNSTVPWERFVFEDSYNEFRMQVQLFNPQNKYLTFAELLQHNPTANQLHFLASPSVVGYLRQLNEKVPDIVNNLGKQFLKFSKFQFEIVNSHIQDKLKHKVAVNFYSTPVIWQETIGNYLLISDQPSTGEEVLTQMFQFQPYLSIYSIKAERQ